MRAACSVSAGDNIDAPYNEDAAPLQIGRYAHNRIVPKAIIGASDIGAAMFCHRR
jgi:hypothetical protein